MSLEIMGMRQHWITKAEVDVNNDCLILEESDFLPFREIDLNWRGRYHCSIHLRHCVLK